MVQQNQTLEKILAVLQENRSNEARQLVSQGVRLYVNQQYDKAEERFLRAIDFDMTDYQVLMNLAYIELHKENADKSMSYFQDALSLPTSLDSSSKARTLWSMARLHYVNRDYQKALLYAEESLKTVYKIEEENPRSIFTLAIYAALAGRKDQALRLVQSSIKMDSDLFTLAAVEPEFESIRQEVLELLGKMSIQSFGQAVDSVEEVQQLIS